VAPAVDCDLYYSIIERFLAVCSIQSNSPSVDPPSTAAKSSGRGRCLLLAAIICLIVVNLPAFIRLGPDSDNNVYDLAARNILWGMVPYRDTFENNFPGVVWMLMGLRSVFGWSSEILFAFDFALVAGLSTILASFVVKARHGDSGFARLLLVFVLLSFYLSTSEWNHAQRDVWMMLPVLLAVRLRVDQVVRLSAPVNGSALNTVPQPKVLLLAVTEGFLWAAGCWVKPYVALVAAATWLIGALVVMRRSQVKINHLIVRDGLAVLCGGLLAAVLGCIWLTCSGGLASFWEIMADWNLEYRKFDPTGGHRLITRLAIAWRFCPWGAVDFLAVPLALATLWRSLRSQMGSSDNSEEVQLHARLAVLAGFYLSLAVQAYFLQHPFDYVHVPVILVGLTFVACWFSDRNWSAELRGESRSWRTVVATAALIMFLLAVCARCAPLWWDRSKMLPQCLSPYDRYALRNRLGLRKQINWSDLKAVSNFLKTEHVRDYELTVFSMPAVWLYLDLGIRPATRYNFVQEALVVFSRQRDKILAALADSHQRFVVCDLSRYGMEKMNSDLQSSSAGSPWPKRIVFRSGNYLVFDIKPAEMHDWLHYYFGY
jgi:hypothetical protein